MSLPFLPLKPASTSGVLDEPDLVSLIVEQVAAGNPAEACRLAVRWCSLNRGRRAQCDANSGLLWRQLAGAVFPTARQSNQDDEAYGYKPKDAQSAGKEWFYHLCTRIKVMKEHKEMLSFAKFKVYLQVHPLFDLNAGTYDPLYGWNEQLEKWKEWHRALAALDQKVRDGAAKETQEDALERRELNDQIKKTKGMLDMYLRLMDSLKRVRLYVVDAQMRLELYREYMADLFPDKDAPEPDPLSVQVHEAYSKLRKETLARLDTPAFIGLERKLWKQRIDAVRRSAADRDSKDPREAQLTALMQEVESHFDTHLHEAVEINDGGPSHKAVRNALYELKYYRYAGFTFAKDEQTMVRVQAALERALD